MITREVREWIGKVENRQYSYEDAMFEFKKLARYLTIDEIKHIKNKLKDFF
jgi:hypothetical protein